MDKSFEIKELDFDSADQAFQLMSSVREGLLIKNWYVATPMDHIREKFESGKALLLGCSDEAGMLYACMLFELPDDNDNYANLLDTKYPAETVVHAENVAVLPKYRGKKLQRYLLEAGEQILRQKYPERVHYLCTVHPNNMASVKNLKAVGYRKVASFDNITDELHSGLRRDVMQKDLQ